MKSQLKQNIKDLEMVDFSFQLSERCKADTGKSIVSQVKGLIGYAHLRDQQTGPDHVFGSSHKHTIY